MLKECVQKRKEGRKELKTVVSETRLRALKQHTENEDQGVAAASCASRGMQEKERKTGETFCSPDLAALYSMALMFRVFPGVHWRPQRGERLLAACCRKG